MKRAIGLTVLVGAGAIAISVASLTGQQAPPGAEIQKVKDNLYMITGGGGNTVAFVTTNGVVLVDTKLANWDQAFLTNPGGAPISFDTELANWGQAILDKVRTVTDRPVTTIVNTHTHGDHVGSNEFFGTNVEIVVHENTRVNMQRMDIFTGDNVRFLPKRTYKDRLSLGSGDDRVDLYYFGPGHTNGDTFVVFPALRTLHSGDMFPGKQTPFIDGNNGGSAINYGTTLKKAANAITDIDTIITGHSPLLTPADLKEYAQFNQDFITWVRGQIKAGKSVEDSAAEYQLPAKYQGYTISTFLGGIRNNIQIAYNELNR